MAVQSISMKPMRSTDVIQLALRIEENGKRCYERLAEKFRHSSMMHRFFSNLALQEGEHFSYFQELGKKLSQQEPNPEEIDYLQSLADNVVFNSDDLEREINSLDSFSEALGFAMQRELDAVNYFNHLKRVVPSEEHHILDELVAEEQGHYQMLIRFFKGKADSVDD